MKRLLALVTVLALSLSLVGGCDGATPAEGPEPSTPSEPVSEPPAAGGGSAYAWLDTELTDAVTGQTFRLSDFKGKPVLLHAFAVW